MGHHQSKGKAPSSEVEGVLPSFLDKPAVKWLVAEEIAAFCDKAHFWLTDLNPKPVKFSTPSNPLSASIEVWCGAEEKTLKGIGASMSSNNADRTVSAHRNVFVDSLTQIDWKNYLQHRVHHVVQEQWDKFLAERGEETVPRPKISVAAKIDFGTNDMKLDFIVNVSGLSRTTFSVSHIAKDDLVWLLESNNVELPCDKESDNFAAQSIEVLSLNGINVAVPQKHSESHPKTSLGHCCWCHRYTLHIEAHRTKDLSNLYTRREYTCLSCPETGKKTVKCRICLIKRNGRPGMAKIHTTWTDERCVQHMGIEQQELNVVAQCGWCMEIVPHVLMEKNISVKGIGRRDIYECSQCRERTVPCRTCGNSPLSDSFVDLVDGEESDVRIERRFARSYATWDDEHCHVCSGMPNPLELTLHDRRCGWCYEVPKYGFRMYRRDNSVSRASYICTTCSGYVTTCRKCKSGKHSSGENESQSEPLLCRAGLVFDDGFCDRCHSAGRFEQLFTKYHLYMDKEERQFVELGISGYFERQLRKESPQKDLAFRAGYMRCFAYLVSSHPRLRMAIAMSLGWSLLTSPVFGDAHAESWEIISKNSLGLMARTNQSWETLTPGINSQYFQLLHRVCRTVFGVCWTAPKLSRAEGMERCRDPLDEVINELEEELTVKIFNFRQSRSYGDQGDTSPMVNTTCSGTEQLERETTRRPDGLLEQKDESSAVERLGPDDKLPIITRSGSQFAVSASKLSIVAIQGAENTLMARIVAGPTLQIFSKQFALVASQAVAIASLAGAVAFLLADLTQLIFGSSEERLVPSLKMILYQKYLLRENGISINLYFPDNPNSRGGL